MRRLWSRYSRWVLLGLALGLLWWTLRAVSAAELRRVLAQLTAAELAALTGLNLLILLTLCARWWLFLLAQGHRIPFFRLVGYRLTAFGISYLTPGPHFGGEPWQVYVVSHRHRVPYADSIAAVTLDKLVEMLVNFAFLTAGVLFIAQQQLPFDASLLWGSPDTGTPAGDPATDGAVLQQLIAYVVALLAIPVGLLIAYRQGRQPISALLRWAARRRHPAPTPDGWLQTVVHSEAQVGRMCREQTRFLGIALLISIISWCGVVWEFWYMTRILGLDLGIAQAILGLIAARLAILLPMPAALGALEAGQALVMSGLGRNPAAGVAIALVIRARDILLAIAGIWIGGFGVWRVLRGRTPQPAPDETTLLPAETRVPTKHSNL